MTNFEKFKDTILKIIAETGDIPAVIDGKPAPCDPPLGDMGYCQRCEFYNEGSCNVGFFLWLFREYAEITVDWSKLPVDTRILVSRDGVTWYKRYFAGYKDGKVYAYHDGCTSWSTISNNPISWGYAKLVEVEEVKTKCCTITD